MYEWRSDWMREGFLSWGGSRTDQTLGWGDFRKTFEKGLKGILNLIFGCNYKEAIEEADYGGGYDKEKLGQNREDIAMVGIISRMKNLQQNNRQEDGTDFEEIGRMFGGPVPSSPARKRTPVTDTSLEVGVHVRDEYRPGGLEETIRSLVRRSIARSLIKIILGSKGCSKKDIFQKQCIETSKYHANLQSEQKDLRRSDGEGLDLDGRLGFTGNPSINSQGQNKPDGTGEKLQNGKGDEKRGGKKVKEYLGQLSDSSYFYKNNKNLAKVLITEIFKEIVGQQKFNNINLLKQSKNCRVGKNGLICPEIGLVGKK